MGVFDTFRDFDTVPAKRKGEDVCDIRMGTLMTIYCILLL